MFTLSFNQVYTSCPSKEFLDFFLFTFIFLYNFIIIFFFLFDSFFTFLEYIIFDLSLF